MSIVFSLPPRSGVVLPSAIVSSTAFSTALASSMYPKCLSIMQVVSIIAVGFAIPFPAISKAAP